MKGLTLVPTPIGNLEDITLRAVRILGEVDGIIAEDTRVTAKLLNHLGIRKPISSFHSHNEHQQLRNVITRLLNGEHLALVSDAGTPAISDPGFLLVRECIRENIRVETLPGPTAFVPALVNSGFPCDRFVFEGFLPHKKGRQTRLKLLAGEERTIVLYESPHRLEKTLGQLAEFFGQERRVCVSRELSKMFEENMRGSVMEVLEHFRKKPAKGEIVIVIEGREGRQGTAEED